MSEASVQSPPKVDYRHKMELLERRLNECSATNGKLPFPNSSDSVTTFCSCCGTRTFDNEGKTIVNWIGRYVFCIPSKEEKTNVYLHYYGDLYEERAKSNKSIVLADDVFDGVILAYMPLEEAKKLIFKEQASLAEGVEIHDKDCKHPISFLWILRKDPTADSPPPEEDDDDEEVE